MTRPDEAQDTPALARLVELARHSPEPPTRAELDRGLNVVRRRLGPGRHGPRQLNWALVGAVVLLLPLLGLLGTGWFSTGAELLTYEVEGGAVLEGGYLREAGSAGIRLTFNEGTRVVLAPGTRGRLRSVDTVGAHLGIEKGSAALEVTPRPGGRWLVEVGPFLVTVKGTEFTVSWDPESEEFALDLKHGEVSVSGPLAAGELSLKTGQHLQVKLSTGETLLTEARAASTGASATALEPAPATPSAEAAAPAPGGPALDVPSPLEVSETRSSVGMPAPKGPGSRAAPRATESAAVPTTPSDEDGRDGRRWADELANGQWDRILQDAERQGLEATLNSASSLDLSALADAARYRRRTDVARRALLALRGRFPASWGALNATFLLGRVEEARGGGSSALAWYDEYLQRAPSGSYAAEALGRKMTILNRIAGPAEASPIARDYLRRFPKGSYAGSARALLGER